MKLYEGTKTEYWMVTSTPNAPEYIQTWAVSGFGNDTHSPTYLTRKKKLKTALKRYLAPASLTSLAASILVPTHLLPHPLVLIDVLTATAFDSYLGLRLVSYCRAAKTSSRTFKTTTHKLTVTSSPAIQLGRGDNPSLTTASILTNLCLEADLPLNRRVELRNFLARQVQEVEDIYTEYQQLKAEVDAAEKAATPAAQAYHASIITRTETLDSLITEKQEAVETLIADLQDLVWARKAALNYGVDPTPELTSASSYTNAVPTLDIQAQRDAYLSLLPANLALSAIEN